MNFVFKTRKDGFAYLKNILSPVIYQAINDFNSDDSKYKVIISGGEALNYYFNNSIETYDFDLKIFLDDEKSLLEYVYQTDKSQKNKIEFMYHAFKIKFVKTLTQTLNEFLDKNPSILTYLKSTNFHLKDEIPFKSTLPENLVINKNTFLKEPLLVSIIYNYTFYSSPTKKFDDEFGIVDVVPYSIRTMLDLGLMDSYVDEENRKYDFLTPFNLKPLKPDGVDVNERNLHRGEYYALQKRLRKGYFKNIISPKVIMDKIYITKLGFVIWDTIRMLNYTTDIILQSRDRESYIRNDIEFKFERYIKKYQSILTAFDEPENFLNCDSMTKFLQKCNQGQDCIVDNTVLTKEQIIDKYISENIIVDNQKWKDTLTSFPKSILCKAISGTLK
jgi:hypothetical protein